VHHATSHLDHLGRIAPRKEAVLVFDEVLAREQGAQLFLELLVGPRRDAVDQPNHVQVVRAGRPKTQVPDRQAVGRGDCRVNGKEAGGILLAGLESLVRRPQEPVGLLQVDGRSPPVDCGRLDSARQLNPSMARPSAFARLQTRRGPPRLMAALV